MPGPTLAFRAPLQRSAPNVAVTGIKLPRAYLPSKGSGLENVRINRIAIDPRHDDTIYAASDKGFCRSTDGGMTWEVLNKGLRIPYAHQVFAPAETPGKLYLSTPAGLHVSTDSGATGSKPIVVLNGMDPPDGPRRNGIPGRLLARPILRVYL